MPWTSQQDELLIECVAKGAHIGLLGQNKAFEGRSERAIQARYAHLKKINSELPFIKKRPTRYGLHSHDPSYKKSTPAEIDAFNKARTNRALRNPALKAYLQSLPPLDQDLREILIGKLLGDAHIRLAEGTKHYCLYICHGERQEAYVMYLYNKLGPWVGSSPIKYIDKDGNIRVSFQTYSWEVFSEFGRLFPADATGWKTLPSNLADLLTKKALAYWLMDDGSFDYHRKTISLATNAFTDSEVDNLVAILKGRFKVDCARKNGKIRVTPPRPGQSERYQDIRMTVAGTRVFIELVRKDVLSMFKYKIGESYAHLKDNDGNPL